MEKDTTYYTGLMVKYFSGEASPEEILHLSDWLSAAQENLELFDEFRQTWLLTTKDALSTNSINLDNEWNQISDKLIESPSKDVTNELKGSLDNQTSHLKGSPVSRAGRLNDAFDNRVVHLKGALIKSMFRSWKVAASLLFLISVAAVWLYLFPGSQMVEVTALNQNMEYLLPDGSVINLYKGSTIKYSKSFKDKDFRKVSLQGDAWFKVQRDTTHPFIVAGNDVMVKVLGTTFNVNTLAGNDKVSVELASGKIALYFKGKESEELFLNPGEGALINTAEQSMQKNVTDDPNSMAWVTGTIIFNNTNFDQVIKTLEKVYQKKIEPVDNGVLNCSLTATFEHQSLEQVMSVISTTLDLQMTEKNNTIFIKGNCE